MKEYLISIPLKILNRENMFWQHYYKDNKAISSLVFANMFQVPSWNLLKKKSFDALKFPWQGFYHHPFPKKSANTHWAKRNHAAKILAASYIISEWSWNFTFDFTEIVSNHILKWAIVYHANFQIFSQFFAGITQNF